MTETKTMTETNMFTLQRKDSQPLEITRAQWQAIQQKFLVSPDGAETFEQFCQRVQPTIGMDQAIVIPWCGMWLAIEQDGYTHS